MITEDYVEISPAYGRDYKSKAQVEVEFRAGKDFVMRSIGHGSRYCSNQDFAKGVKVNIRYAKMTKVVVVTA